MAWETKTKIFGLPLFSVGFAPVGFFVIGFSGAGVIVIAQFGIGIITVSQGGLSVFGIMQFGAGIFVFGQAVIGLILSIGQAALGFIALGFEDMAGYYEARVGKSFLGSLDKLLSEVYENPEPLVVWIVSWVILVTFIVTQWPKLRKGLRLVDFFRSPLKHSSYKVRINAVNNEVDREELKKVALHDKAHQVRAAAVHRIRDEDFLLNIVLKERKHNVKQSALAKITNQQYLCRIVKELSISNIRSAALKRIHDQPILREIALSDLPKDLRSAAAKKINEKSSLKDIVFSNASAKAQRIAIDRIRDQEMLLGIVLSDLPRAIRVHALSRITDIGILVQAYREWPEPGPPLKSMKAVKKIKNQKILNSLALESKSAAMRHYFVTYLDDPGLVQQLIDNDPSEKVQKKARKYIRFFKPRYSKMQIKVDCPGCSQPLFINGPYKMVTCAYCGKETKVSENFFQQLLPYSFEKGRVFSYVADLVDVDFSGGEEKPQCGKCGRKLPLPEKKISREHAVSCSKCSTEHRCIPAPSMLKGIQGSQGEYYICGEAEQVIYIHDAESELNKNMKPVAVACVSCGSTLTINVETPRNTTCPYCNTTQYLPDPLWRSLHPVPKRRSWYIRWAPLKKKN